MRVTTNSFPDSLVNHLQRLATRMTTLQNQTATGQRIVQPSDDPAAAVRVLGYQADRARLAQYHRNAARAQDIVNAGTTQLRNLLDVSDRANEVITLSSDVLGDAALSAYGTEINALLEQAVVNANSQFNGDPLFGGTTGNLPPFTVTRDADGRITAVAYEGAANTAEMQVAADSRLSPYTDQATNLQIRDFLQRLVSLRDTLQSGDVAAVKGLATDLQGSEDDLIHGISGQGALLHRLEFESAQNEAVFTQLETQISRDADADLAETVVQLTQNQNAYQAALQSAGRVLNLSLLDYL